APIVVYDDPTGYFRTEDGPCGRPVAWNAAGSVAWGASTARDGRDVRLGAFGNRELGLFRHLPVDGRRASVPADPVRGDHAAGGVSGGQRQAVAAADGHRRHAGFGRRHQRVVRDRLVDRGRAAETLGGAPWPADDAVAR